MRVQVGRDVVFDMLERQLLKAHLDDSKSNSVEVIKTTHSKLFRYRNDDGCLEVEGDSLLGV